jgi:hypothetical protein
MFLFGFMTMFVTSWTYAQVLEEKAKQGNIEILGSVTVRQGEGCVQATKRSGFQSLTEKECFLLLRHYDRSLTKSGHVVFEGERFVYVKTVHGVGWVFLSLENLRE